MNESTITNGSLTSSTPSSSTPQASDLSNCRYCSGITLSSLSKPGGYRHASNRASLVRSAQKCRFCSLLFRRDRTRHTVPLYLSLEQSNASEADEVGQVCLRVRHGNDEDPGAKAESDGVMFFLYTEPGDPAGDFGITVKRELSRTDSSESFDAAAQWLDDCRSEHICSKKLPLKEHENEFHPWPSRLIDVRAFDDDDDQIDVRLVDNDDPTREHICLSYCWGTSKTFTTTSRSLRLRKTRIKFQVLPKTFQDAVIITRRLGKRYLWIDALCIIQDDRRDWERESVKMGAIYSTAYVTIAADSGSDCHSGCFNTASLSQELSFDNVSFELSFTVEGKQSIVYVWDPSRGAQISTHPEIDGSPLAERGWVCQERILSPRILHYTSSQLFWECRECFLAEDNLRPWTVWTAQSGTVCGLARNLYGLTFDPIGRSRLLGIWYNSVVSQSYSRRKLTLPEDKLTAISGVARAFGRHFMTSYLAGLWQLDLPWGLSWRRRGGTGSTRAQSYRAPSFSWAALDAPVEWPIPSDTANSKIEIITTETHRAGSDPYGRVTRVSLSIKAYTSRATIVARKRINAGAVDVAWELVGNRKQWLGNAFMDDADPAELQEDLASQDVEYVVLSHDETKGDSQVLLIRRTDERGTAVRIGVAEIMGLDGNGELFDERNLCTLVLL